MNFREEGSQEIWFKIDHSSGSVHAFHFYFTLHSCMCVSCVVQKWAGILHLVQKVTHTKTHTYTNNLRHCSNWYASNKFISNDRQAWKYMWNRWKRNNILHCFDADEIVDRTKGREMGNNKNEINEYIYTHTGCICTVDTREREREREN